MGTNNTSTSFLGTLHFPTTMRTQPTLTGSSGLYSSDFATYDSNSTSNSVAQGHTSATVFSLNGTSLALYRPSGAFFTQSTASFIALSSEL
jgi:hypothetical protein